MKPVRESTSKTGASPFKPGNGDVVGAESSVTGGIEGAERVPVDAKEGSEGLLVVSRDITSVGGEWWMGNIAGETYVGLRSYGLKTPLDKAYLREETISGGANVKSPRARPILYVV